MLYGILFLGLLVVAYLVWDIEKAFKEMNEMEDKD